MNEKSFLPNTGSQNFPLMALRFALTSFVETSLTLRCFVVLTTSETKEAVQFEK